MQDKKEQEPKMDIKDKQPLVIFKIDNSFILAVYQGSLSKFDILIKYRQFINGKWSRIRTPKHIHWAVDILIKQYFDKDTTDKLLDYLIDSWKETTGFENYNDRKKFLNKYTLLSKIENDSKEYIKINDKGEYSIKFLILLALLLMEQEKTNYKQAYMFKNLLDALKEHKDIFKIISTATHSKK